MRFARAVFLIAGIYGLAIVTPMYFLEERIGREYPPAITHPDYFYGFIGVTLACQLFFLVLGSDPVRFRPMMLPAIFEKVSYGIALIVLALQHRIPAIVMGIGSVDWVLAVLFTASFFATA